MRSRRTQLATSRSTHWGNGFVTFASNYLQWENTQRCAELLDAVGYNYGTGLYRAHREKYPHWVIYGSETSAVSPSSRRSGTMKRGASPNCRRILTSKAVLLTPSTS